MAVKQLLFDLRPPNPWALKYFVTHSGVVEAVRVLDHALSKVLDSPESFAFVYLYGQQGLGKSHLIEGYAQSALEKGLSDEAVYSYELLSETDVTEESWTGDFVAVYEKLKASGGLLLAAAEKAPASLSKNPHLRSRFLTAQNVRVSAPSEEELRPILCSLLERRNLKLSERGLDYLLKRLPLSPLSFDNIFARISELSSSELRPANFSVVREVFKEDDT